MTTRYAGFWIRSVSNTIDSFVLILPCWLAWLGVSLVLSFFGSSPEKSFDGQTLQYLITALYLVVAFPYFVWGHFHWGTTLGKKVLGIYVVRAGTHDPITIGQSVLRYFGYIASSLPMGAGYLMAALHPQKRSLHDLISGTEVVVRA